MTKRGVVLWACLTASACGGPMNVHEVKIRPRVMTQGATGPTEVISNRPVAWLDGDAPVVPDRTDGEGNQVFTVPNGPALFRVSDMLFVYGADEAWEPCDPLPLQVLSPRVTSSTTWIVGLSQPASAHDALFASTQPAPLPTFATLDAGVTRFEGTVARALSLDAPTVLTHVTLDEQPGVARSLHALARFDAGVLTDGATVAGDFVALPPASPQPLSFNGPALQAAFGGTAPAGDTFLEVLQGGSLLARAWGPATVNEQLSVPVAGTPDELRVSGGSVLLFQGVPPLNLSHEWATRQPASLSIDPPAQPPTAVAFSADGLRVTWSSSSEPNAWLLRFSAEGKSALLFTDEKNVPVPPGFEGAGVTVDVWAVRGGDISATGCPTRFRERGAPWSTFAARVSR